ncbi:MAG: WbuC family cupin fold metalloprotein [Bacteroides graminisolvens]|nr:WbuC family cupin fold metalloprotein [Bacteroides graminisolvens]
MTIDQELLDKLFAGARENPRLRTNLDLRTSNEDSSQRMLNAMLPGTKVAIHRHPMSDENVILIKGRLDEVLYEEVIEYSNDGDSHLTDVARKVTLREMKRIHLCPAEGKFGCQVPKGVWHTVEVIEPSVIYEGKDGKYGEDGSEPAEKNWLICDL